jgi:hypothetical protein
MAICNPCLSNWFATSEVAIETENLVIPALGTVIVFKTERLARLPKYFVQHLLDCLLLLIKPLVRNIAVPD